MEAGAPVRPTERRISQPAAAGRRTEGAIPRLRVTDVRSPRAAYRAVPGASCLLCPHADLHRCYRQRGRSRRLGVRHLRAQQPPLRARSGPGTHPGASGLPHLRRRPEPRRHGYTVFGWTFGVWDSDPRVSAEEIRARVRRKLRPGAIILLHDGDGYDPRGDRRRTAAALPGIIADARTAGYTFRPLGDLVL